MSRAHDLPVELFHTIFQVSDVETLKAAVLVSSRFKHEAGKYLWRSCHIGTGKTQQPKQALCILHDGATFLNNTSHAHYITDLSITFQSKNPGQHHATRKTLSNLARALSTVPNLQVLRVDLTYVNAALRKQFFRTLSIENRTPRLHTLLFNEIQGAELADFLRLHPQLHTLRFDRTTGHFLSGQYQRDASLLPSTTTPSDHPIPLTLVPSLQRVHVSTVIQSKFIPGRPVSEISLMMGNITAADVMPNILQSTTDILRLAIYATPWGERSLFSNILPLLPSLRFVHVTVPAPSSASFYPDALDAIRQLPKLEEMEWLWQELIDRKTVEELYPRFEAYGDAISQVSVQWTSLPPGARSTVETRRVYTKRVNAEEWDYVDKQFPFMQSKHSPIGIEFPLSSPFR